MTPDSPPRTRPGWARWLDRLGLLAERIAGRLVPSPSEETLARLAGVESRRNAAGLVAGPELANAMAGLSAVQQGRLAFEGGRYGEALHWFGQATQKAPDNPWAWHGRGDALQLLGQHVDALDAYTRAAQLAPDTGLHHAGRANALKSLDRGQEAHQAQVRAQTCDPTLEWMAPTE